MKHHRLLTRPVAPAVSPIQTKMTFLVNLTDQIIKYIFQKSSEL